MRWRAPRAISRGTARIARDQPPDAVRPAEILWPPRLSRARITQALGSSSPLAQATRSALAAPWGGIAVAAIRGAARRSLLIVRHIRDAPHPAAARGELIESLNHYQAGDISAARIAAASRATRDDPDWGLAHALLARLDLAAGDGAAAEAELDRAAATGFDPARAHHLYAEAWLLEGDPDKAIAEAARALPRYVGYATRVTARSLAANGDLPDGRAMLGTAARRKRRTMRPAGSIWPICGCNRATMAARSTAIGRALSRSRRRMRAR